VGRRGHATNWGVLRSHRVALGRIDFREGRKRENALVVPGNLRGGVGVKILKHEFDVWEKVGS